MADNPSAKKTCCPYAMCYQRPYQLTSTAITWLTPGKGQNFDHDNQNNDKQLGICMHRGFGFNIIKNINVNLHFFLSFCVHILHVKNCRVWIHKKQC
jgi:hypothetical protein